MLGAVTDAMSQTRTVTKSALTNAGLTDESQGLQGFTTLQALLKKETVPLGIAYPEPLAIQAQPAVTATPAVDPEVAAGTIKKMKKERKPRKPKDPNAPNRPVTAFFMYSAQQRPILKELFPSDAKPGEIQKRLQDNWNLLPEEDKEVST